MSGRTVLLIAIGAGLVVNGTPGPITLSTPYSATLAASGGSGRYTFTETGALPTGITFTDNGDGTATIAGTTTAAGNYPISVLVKSPGGYNKKYTYVLNVVALIVQLLQTVQLFRGVAATGGRGVPVDREQPFIEGPFVSQVTIAKHRGDGGLRERGSEDETTIILERLQRNRKRDLAF